MNKSFSKRLLLAAMVSPFAMSLSGPVTIVATWGFRLWPGRIGDMEIGFVVGAIIGYFGIPISLLLCITNLKITAPVVCITTISASMIFPLVYPLGMFGPLEYLIPASGVMIVTILVAALISRLCSPFQTRNEYPVCPSCGYRIGTSPRCTECGKLLPFNLRPRP